jgi:hypothetical protein
MARHIVTLQGLDDQMRDVAPEAVHRIATLTIGEKSFWFLSFASKYCSWQNPASYPIFDSNVVAYLWDHQKQDGIPHFFKQDLWDYLKFVEIVRAFRAASGMDDVRFKEFDKYMYLKGGELIALGRAEAISSLDPPERGITV